MHQGPQSTFVSQVRVWASKRANSEQKIYRFGPWDFGEGEKGVTKTFFSSENKLSDSIKVETFNLRHNNLALNNSICLESCPRWNQPITSPADMPQSQTGNNTQHQLQGLIVVRGGIPPLWIWVWHHGLSLDTSLLWQPMHSWIRALLALYHAWIISTTRKQTITSFQNRSISGKESLTH